MSYLFNKISMQDSTEFIKKLSNLLRDPTSASIICILWSKLQGLSSLIKSVEGLTQLHNKLNA